MQNEQTEKRNRLKLSKKTVMKLSFPSQDLSKKGLIAGNNFVLTLDCGGDSFYRKCTGQSL